MQSITPINTRSPFITGSKARIMNYQQNKYISIQNISLIKNQGIRYHQ